MEEDPIAEYIAAFQSSLDAARAGQDTTGADKAMAKAKRRMRAAIKKYD